MRRYKIDLRSNNRIHYLLLEYNMRIFLTGAFGFIGTQLVRQLSAKTDCTLKACVRKKIELPEGVRAYQVNDIGKEHHWSAILSDIDVVIHLAGYIHLPPGLTCEIGRAHV